MGAVNAAQAAAKTVADPNASYESMMPLWRRSRAVCSGERYVKAYDGALDTVSFKNLLIPFSPSMTSKQYAFYTAEAELPGITAEFAKMLIGGLLRKQPTLTLPEGTDPEIGNWILNQFGKDDSPLSAFLFDALHEEIRTSRAWVFVDYPSIPNAENLDKEELDKFKPYPVLHPAESVINWRVRQDAYGKTILDRVIIRGFEETYEKNEFHPDFIDTVWVHDLDESSCYRIRKYQMQAPTHDVPVIAGQQIKDPLKAKSTFVLVETNTNILFNGERLTQIPAWPLNGSVEAVEPMLGPIIDKEVALYNKISRRNHLMYGASTYTPVICSDMTNEEFDQIVDKGLGSWLKLDKEDTATVLETPTAALQDMEKAIAAGIEEMARLGIRMLTPETSQSGVALEIRNAAQTAQLGTLNMKISNVLRQIIVFMINWRYDLDLTVADVQFSLSEDFNPIPLGADWLRLATEWYQQGLIPRSVWIQILKTNDMLLPDYDDKTGQEEITNDNMIMLGRQTNLQYAAQVAQDKLGLTPPDSQTGV